MQYAAHCPISINMLAHIAAQARKMHHLRIRLCIDILMLLPVDSKSNRQTEDIFAYLWDKDLGELKLTWFEGKCFAKSAVHSPK